MPKKKKKEKGDDDKDKDTSDMNPLNKDDGSGDSSNKVTIKPSVSFSSRVGLPSTLTGKGNNEENSEHKEMERALEEHQREEGPGKGGGMGVFAINKDGISRAVAKFIEKPKPQPLSVSFQFPGTFLTHKYVMAVIRQFIHNIPNADVTHVQYQDRNVRLGTRGIENRWVVSVTPLKAKEQLIRMGIKVVNRTVLVKSYDDVINDEWREYQRYADLQNKMKMGFGAKSKKAASPESGTAVGAEKEGEEKEGEEEDEDDDEDEGDDDEEDDEDEDDEDDD